MPASPASAAVLTGNIVVSSPTTGKVAANTAKQVILLTLTLPAGTTLSEENIKTVSLGATRCTDMEWYIVTGTTQIAAKTPDDADDDANDGCAPTASSTTGETIVITFANDDTLTKAGSNLFFVAPPAIAAANTGPVVTENSYKITDPDDRVKRLIASGGQTVRITASADFAFSGGTAAGLSVTIGGKALTEVKAWNKAGTTALTAAAADADKGNTLTGKTATGMTTSSPTVVITQNGVSKSFNTTASGITVVAAPVVTALSLTSVKAGVDTNVTVTGTGLATTATAKVCGVTATVVTPPTSAGTSMVITVPAGIVDADPGLGTGVYAGVCPVVITGNSVDSPISEKSWIAVVSE
jgi:hypothetical protein